MQPRKGLIKYHSSLGKTSKNKIFFKCQKSNTFYDLIYTLELDSFGKKTVENNKNFSWYYQFFGYIFLERDIFLRREKNVL